MKKTMLWTMGAALLVAAMAVPLLASDEAKGAKEVPKGAEVTLTGYIGDSMCGLDHSDMMKKHSDAPISEAACVEACVKGGAKYILADREAGKTYNLKDQKRVAGYAGKRVEIVGEVDGEGVVDIHKLTLAPK